MSPPPTIAIGLLTCNREDYTQRTLETLALHNDLSRFILVHADDGSETCENMDIASDFGFRESFRAHRREGQFAMLKCLLAMAQRKQADWFLYLENDWEWVRPFPWEVMSLLAPDECMRLYGAQKGREGPRIDTGAHLMGTRILIDWRPRSDGWEAAYAHWAGPPSVIATKRLAAYVDIEPSFKEVSNTLWPMTWRPTENVCWHIGQQQTASFKA
jgi:hypothetical protein